MRKIALEFGHIFGLYISILRVIDEVLGSPYIRRPLYAEHGPQLILLCGFLEKWNKTKSHHDPHHSHFVFKTSFTQGLNATTRPSRSSLLGRRETAAGLFIFMAPTGNPTQKMKSICIYIYVHLFIHVLRMYIYICKYRYICVCVRVYVWLLFIALHTYVYNSWSLALDLQTIQLVCWLIPGPLSQQLVGVFRPWQTSWQCTSNRGACWVALVCGEMLETGSMAQTVDRFGNLQSWEIDFLISPKIPRVTFPNQLN